MDGVKRWLKGSDVEYEGKMEAKDHAKVLGPTLLAMEMEARRTMGEAGWWRGLQTTVAQCGVS